MNNKINMMLFGSLFFGLLVVMFSSFEPYPQALDHLEIDTEKYHDSNWHYISKEGYELSKSLGCPLCKSSTEFQQINAMENSD